MNDASPNKDLREPLERYVKLLPRKVILVRTRKREGLMRARMIGAGMATGDVLFFQDGHTENNAGWAEPLLYEIVKNPHTVIQPSVDQIEAWTIEYVGGYSIGAVPRGGFSWDLRYVLEHLAANRSTQIVRLKSRNVQSFIEKNVQLTIQR